ncbi:MAG: sigma-70 family RNA polymerase sigma factor [Planctomycetota bacterium]|nr:MAG: sigma-70 family RNA polymerase sigma factor [Planctomycetota bacterium]
MAPPPHTPASFSAEQLLAEAGFLRRLARELARDDSRADDLVQDTFAAALEHPPSRPGPLRGWLAAIARNLSRNAQRGDARRDGRERAAARDELVEPDELALERLEQSRALSDLVVALPVEQRTVLYLRYYEALTPTEIAARLGVPLKTIASRQTRGLQTLRERLDARAGGDRRAWVLALAPLGARPRAALLAAPGGMFGGLAMKKLVVALVALVLLVLGWFVAQRAFDIGRPRGVRIDETASLTLPAPAAAALSEAVVEAHRAQVATAAEAAPVATTGSAEITLLWSDGTPAAGVGATIERPVPRGARRETWSATSDADGCLRFAELAPGKRRLRVDARANFELEIAAGEETSADFTIPSGANVRGRVLDVGGAPIAGAVIAFDAHGSTAPDVRALAIADAQGRFELRDVAEWQAIGARAAGYAPSKAIEVGEFALDGIDFRTVEFRLQRGENRLRGRVLAPDGAPISSARVVAGAPIGSWIHDASGMATGLTAPPFAAKSGADGRFEVLDALPDGAQPVTAIAFGYAPWSGTVEFPADPARELEIRLAPAARIEGRVLGIDGRPAAGVRVVQSPETGGGWHDDAVPSAADTTDADGWFELEWIEPGTREVCASDSSRPELGRARVNVTCIAGETARCELVLDLGNQIAGRVLDEQGAPLAGWSVHSQMADLLNRWYPRHTRTGADGSFRLVNLGDGTHDLNVRAPGGGAPRLEQRGVAAGTQGLELVVPDARVVQGTVRGRLVDPTATAFDDVQVTLWRVGQREGHYLEIDGATGSFEGQAYPGNYRLQFVRRGTQLVDLPEFEIAEARVTDLGDVASAALGDVELALQGLPPADLARLVVALERDGFPDARLVNEAGVLRAAGVLPGRWRIRLLEDELAIEPDVLDVLPGGTTRAVVAVTLRRR